LIVELAIENLRRKIYMRPNELLEAQRLSVSYQFAHPKVSNFDSVSFDKNIVCFQVAVNDLVVVGELQPQQQLGENLKQFFL
jgi:hypothetical protein